MNTHIRNVNDGAATVQSKQRSLFAQIISTTFWVLVFGLLLVKLLFFQQVTVVGQSMEPNYHDGELLLVNNANRNYKRGQVVAVYEDREVAEDANYFTRYSARFFLKRIIGLPGEEVEVIGSRVVIYNSEFPNGRVIVEDYIPTEIAAREENRNEYFERTAVPFGEYFVMGDNRSNSTDSRERGTFPDFSMFGKESFRFWPSEEFSLFELPVYEYQELTPEIFARRAELQDKERDQLGGFMLDR